MSSTRSAEFDAALRTQPDIKNQVQRLRQNDAVESFEQEIRSAGRSPMKWPWDCPHSRQNIAFSDPPGTKSNRVIISTDLEHATERLLHVGRGKPQCSGDRSEAAVESKWRLTGLRLRKSPKLTRPIGKWRWGCGGMAPRNVLGEAFVHLLRTLLAAELALKLSNSRGARRISVSARRSASRQE
jgi:hypothetical protein